MVREGIVQSKELKEDLISVSRKSDPVMNIELGLEAVVNIMCAYAPQVDCIENKKKPFGNILIKS